MCGPSSQAKGLNSAIQAFAANTAGEAQQIFGDTSGIFNELNSSLGQIVKGGPSQQGWSAAETNAVNSQIMEQSATNARNVKAAVGNSVAAIGGGNAVTPSGLAAELNTQADIGVEAQKSQELSNATIANYNQGNQNYFKAVAAQQQLPGMFSTSNQANQTASSAYGQAEQSQQAIDKANNWWQPMVMAGLGAAGSFVTGGLGNMGEGSGIGDFVKGGLGMSTPAPSAPSAPSGGGDYSGGF